MKKCLESPALKKAHKKSPNVHLLFNIIYNDLCIMIIRTMTNYK